MYPNLSGSTGPTTGLPRALALNVRDATGRAAAGWATATEAVIASTSRRTTRRAIDCYPYQPTTSTMTLVEPKSLRMSILPPAESLTMTRLGTACPATKLRSEAPGAVVPSGQTTRSLAAVGPSTVTLSTTAFAVPGTPPLPATGTIMVCPWPSGELNPPVPLRVSTIRVGLSTANDAPLAALSVK